MGLLSLAAVVALSAWEQRLQSHPDCFECLTTEASIPMGLAFGAAAVAASLAYLLGSARPTPYAAVLAVAAAGVATVPAAWAASRGDPFLFLLPLVLLTAAALGAALAFVVHVVRGSWRRGLRMALPGVAGFAAVYALSSPWLLTLVVAAAAALFPLTAPPPRQDPPSPAPSDST
jgi:hypothetical protein